MHQQTLGQRRTPCPESTAQKFEMTQKQPMMYLAIDISREGSTVRFYTNHVDDMNDRSMVSVIQSCH